MTEQAGTMIESLSWIGYVTAAIALGLLITSVVIFFRFRIPSLYKELRGGLQEKEIEELRLKKSASVRQRGKENVFEELEKKAVTRRGNTGRLNMMTTGSLAGKKSAASQVVEPIQGTAVLQNAAKSANQNFIIEKNIMFVSTNEVL